jgi:hypothetical protein
MRNNPLLRRQPETRRPANRRLLRLCSPRLHRLLLRSHRRNPQDNLDKLDKLDKKDKLDRKLCPPSSG